MALVRRAAGKVGPQGPAEPLGPGELLAGFPGLAEWLVLGSWPDGTARVTGTVLLFVEDGRWKAWLNDRDGGMGCFVSGRSPEEVLAAAEKAVGLAGGDWRANRQKGRRGG